MELYLHSALLFFAVFSLSAAFLLILIPLLLRRRAAQPILEIGPSWHRVKAGTPTMGGLALMAAAALVVAVDAVLLLLSHRSARELFLLPVVGYGLLCAAIGFADDFLKLKKGKNQGLTAFQKFLLQVLAAAFFLYLCHAYFGVGTAIRLPFSDRILALGVFFDPLALLFLVGVDNALNLTDGLDGLLSATVAVLGGFFLLWGGLVGEEGAVLCGALLLGLALSFLLFNAHPAKIFMGDTGSLFLGGLVGGVGIMCARPVSVLLAGGVYLLEVASVVLQVVYFRWSDGKRLFLMAPLHHHLEKKGMAENHIVALAVAITALLSAVALLGR